MEPDSIGRTGIDRTRRILRLGYFFSATIPFLRTQPVRGFKILKAKKWGGVPPPSLPGVVGGSWGPTLYWGPPLSNGPLGLRLILRIFQKAQLLHLGYRLLAPAKLKQL